MVNFDVPTLISHLAILLNGFLIWLIRKKAGKLLGDYIKVLYLGAFHDLIFAIAIVLSGGVIIDSAEFYYIVINGWAAYLGHPWDFLCVVSHVYFSYTTLTVASVQFIYRFFLIFWNVTLTTKAFLGLVALSLLAGAYNFVTFFIFFFPKPNEFEIYAPILFETGKVAKEQVKSFVVTELKNLPQIKVYTRALPIVCFAIIIFCSAGVWYRLWKHKKQNQSISYRKIQNQITVVLLCEALVPLITMVIPMQFLNNVREIWPWFPPMLTQIIAFSPIFNPIVKIAVISPFRKCIFGIFIKPKNPRVSVTVTLSSHSPSGRQPRLLSF